MSEHNQYVQSASHYPSTWRRKRSPRIDPVSTSPYSWVGPFTSEKFTFIVSTSKLESVTAVDEAVFKKLSAEWWKETAALSSLEKKVLHPAYQRIIALGPGAVPLILKEMKSRPGHWFWALDALTQGLNPAHYCKTLTEATQAWLRWGESQGYL
jgi:hypothetical protein